MVIGAGHAGIEAACAAAKLGAKTALFTLTLDGIGNLPCNPSIGGTAKGHLVREIDALGGVMGIAADATFLQSRMLNMGKGPAVHSLRVQTDRRKYHAYMKQLLEKTRHQIFVEPCGLDTEEMYLQGMSSSLPEAVQNEMYRTIEGFEHLEIMRPAYAIEYDCADPTALAPTLEFKEIRGLYGAGQFNGTSGYEEAAAQGLLAGLNAARAVQGRPGIVLKRQESYIGTLVDDLVTKGVLDPYRMMTSRSEYRLYLRQDNADERLTPLGREIGLVDDARWAEFNHRRAVRREEAARLTKVVVRPADANPVLAEKGEPLLTSGASAAELLRRPALRYTDIARMLPENPDVTPFIAYCLETEIKYEGYIKRQQSQIGAVKRQEETPIPEDFDYAPLTGLRLEAREKLAKIRPRSVGQAARIPGVGPADVACLAVELAKRRRSEGKE